MGRNENLGPKEFGAMQVVLHFYNFYSYFGSTEAVLKTLHSVGMCSAVTWDNTSWSFYFAFQVGPHAFVQASL
jgi:hypothetical protein